MQAGLTRVEKKQLPHMLCVTNMLLHGIEDPSFVRHDNTLARPYISYGQATDRVDVILTNPPFGGREEDGIESNFPQHFRTRETADLFLALIIRLLKPGGRAAVVLPDGSLFGEGVKTRLKEHLMEECNLHTIVRLPNSVFRPYASHRHQPAVLREGRAHARHLVLGASGARGAEGLFHDPADPAGASGRLRRLVGRAAPRGAAETERAWKVSAEEVKARGYNLDIKNPHTVAEDHGDPETLLEDLDEPRPRWRRSATS
jgi:type I restriction enzyme M protein